VTAGVTVPRCFSRYGAPVNRRLYALHRWISALALIQLTIWLGTGLFFAVFPIERVRGSGRSSALELLTPDDGVGVLTPATVLVIVANAGLTSVRALELRHTGRGPVYVARGSSTGDRMRLDARTGSLAPVDRDEAARTAAGDQGGRATVRDAQLVEREPGVEYRDEPLPAWKVSLEDDARTAIWVDGWTGEVTARRGDLWRTYDFLWSLHIMDYRGRESFHHPLLIGMASLGLLTVLSGVALWLVRISRRLGRQPRKARAERG
jgi:hypothetical protein